jgi:hypothetical protein
MRYWLSGPRILNGLVRPGISFSGRELAVWGKKPAAISPAGTLGMMRRADGAIFLAIPDRNGDHEREPLTPVAAFCFTGATAAEMAREGALVRLATHMPGRTA